MKLPRNHAAQPEAPEGGGGLVLVRIVGGQPHVGLLGLGEPVGGLEQLRLQQERVRGVRALRVLADQPVERGQRRLAVAPLAEPPQLEQPARAALGGHHREGIDGGGDRGLVAAETARGVHDHAEGALADVGRGLLGHQRFRLAAGALDEAAREQALRAEGALAGRRRGCRRPRPSPVP